MNVESLSLLVISSRGLHLGRIVAIAQFSEAEAAHIL